MPRVGRGQVADQLLKRRGLGWVPVVTGTLGTVLGILGILVSLYAAEARKLLASTLSRFIAEASTVGLAVFISCILTVLACRWLFQAERASRLMTRSLDIRGSALGSDVPDEDVVVGRTLKYIERRRASEELIVCLHGLGLDADDFRPYLNETKYHAVAMTLFGFNVEERDDQRYRPISLATQANLVSYTISRLQAQYPDKKLVLVGFSIGADLLMLLSERWVSQSQDTPDVHAMLLLDPNVNHSTMNISSAIARLDLDQPLDALRSLAREANTLIEFRNMCSYLYKITSKNLHQIRKFAIELVQCWRDGGSFDQFLNRIDAVAGVTDRVMAVFSFHYENHFNSALRAARARGFGSDLLDCTQYDHFALMTPEVLNELVREVLN